MKANLYLPYDVNWNVVETSQLASNIDYDVNNNPIYVWYSFPQFTDDALPTWAIQKITYDVGNNPLTVRWASWNWFFNKVWDDRATYTY